MWRKPCPSVLSAQQIPHGQQYMSVLCKLPRCVSPILTSFSLINTLYDKSSMYDFSKIRPVETEVFLANRRTERKT